MREACGLSIELYEALMRLGLSSVYCFQGVQTYSAAALQIRASCVYDVACAVANAPALGCRSGHDKAASVLPWSSCVRAITVTGTRSWTETWALGRSQF
jgi:hypothetical protein